MPRIVLDVDPALTPPPSFEDDTAELVYFLSWAFSARYGADHELSHFSMLLRGEYGIDLRPLLTFADREIEMDADAEMLDRAWQEAGPLAETCARVARTMALDDSRIVSIREQYPALRGLIEQLAAIADRAASHSARIRITFEMD